jgi:hypothetical protein
MYDCLSDHGFLLVSTFTEEHLNVRVQCVSYVTVYCLLSSVARSVKGSHDILIFVAVLFHCRSV